jgi:hypothetical protein
VSLSREQKGAVRVLLAIRDRFGREEMLAHIKFYGPSYRARVQEICDQAWAKGNRGKPGDEKGFT